jgi:Ca2+-binding RTX toxin-like protein
MQHSIRLRRGTAALCSAGAVLSMAAFAPAAFAGTAQVSGAQFSYEAGLGEKNDVLMQQGGPGFLPTQLRVTEKSGAPIAAGFGCAPMAAPTDPLTGAPTGPPPNGVLCDISGVTVGNINVADRTDIVRAFGVDFELTILGGTGPDNLQGGDKPDIIRGEADNDLLDGNGGADMLEGGDGNDVLRSAGVSARPAADTLNCGLGVDSFEADASDIIDASCERPPAPAAGGSSTPVRQQDISRGVVPTTALPRQESGACDNEVFGTQNADRALNGTDDGDMMFGLGGSDIINGLQEDDCLSGGEGNDRLNGASGNDRLEGDVGRDILSGSTGDDGLLGASGNDSLNGGTGNDVLDGGAGRDRLTGGAGNDVLAGGAGNDTITGGQGRNVVGAGPGNDIVNSVNGKREIINCGTGRDRVRADRSDRLVGCERVSRSR